MSRSIQRLTWDSEHFGVPIGRVAGVGFDAAAARTAIDAAREEGLACLYLLLDAGDRAGLKAAGEHGFELVDVRLTLDRRASAVASEDGVRPLRPEDLATLEDVAAEAHTDSRFFFDPRFDDAAAADLYRRWLRGSVDGRLADIAVVVDVEDRPGGYITGRTSLDGTTVAIGLLAVAPWARGRGLGSRLVDSLLHAADDRGAERVTVVTQGRNVPAQRLYQAAGFRTERLELWFHRWEPF